MNKFIKELKKRGGHVLDYTACIGGYLLYYREYGDYTTNTLTKKFLTK